jgi:triacylglycerol lipase
MAGHDVSRHLLDPDLGPMLEAVPHWRFSAATLARIREEKRAQTLATATAPDLLERTEVRTCLAPGPAGSPDVRVLVYRPKGARVPLPCILHIHGGGFVIGTADDGAPRHRALVLQADCVLVTVDYRLAPETPFPGAIDDCLAALRWLFAHAAALGVDPQRIGLKGESAGGGLAAALALRARDEGGPAIAFQHLIYPMLDDRTCVAADPPRFAGEYIWTPQDNAYGWAALLGVPPGADGVSPYAAPARARDLAGLPPTFIATGALDLFVEEDVEYARRLLRAGVPTELHVYPGGVHGFDVLADVRLSRALRRDSLAALRLALHPGGD